MIIFGLLSESIHSKILSELSMAEGLVGLERFRGMSALIETCALLSLHIDLQALHIRLYSTHTEGVDLPTCFRGTHPSSFMVFFDLVDGFIRLSEPAVRCRVVMISIHGFGDRYIGFIRAIVDIHIQVLYAFHRRTKFDVDVAVVFFQKPWVVRHHPGIIHHPAVFHSDRFDVTAFIKRRITTGVPLGILTFIFRIALAVYLQLLVVANIAGLATALIMDHMLQHQRMEFWILILVRDLSADDIINIGDSLNAIVWVDDK